MPSLEGRVQPPSRTVLIWGGSSAVGSNAIQLAKGAGIEVVTTCSSRSFQYVKSLGARKVFDYNSPTAIDDIVAELDNSSNGLPCAGIYLAAGRVADACQVSARSRQSLFVSTSNPVLPGDCPEGVDAKMAYGMGGVDAFKTILPATFSGYMVEALNMGIYHVAPPPQIVCTKGIEGIQRGLDQMKKGVSARKILIEAS